jgi:hypothetical protein
LYDTLYHASNIVYLTLDGMPHHNLLPASSMSLPNLKILRLARANTALCGRIGQWSLPSLHHLVVEYVPADYTIQPILFNHCDAVKTVELGQNLCFSKFDCLHTILSHTQAHEIGYFVLFVAKPQIDQANKYVKCIRWHAQANLALDNQVAHVMEHLALLQIPTLLPSVANLILHGSWEGLLACGTLLTQFAKVKGQRTLNIIYADGRQVLPTGVLYTI